MREPTDLRTARKRVGLTQVELADLVGVSQPNIAGMESAARAVSKAMGNQLAQYVGVESAELVIANRLAAYKRGKQESDARAVLTAAKAIVEALGDERLPEEGERFVDGIVQGALDFAEESQGAYYMRHSNQ